MFFKYGEMNVGSRSALRGGPGEVGVRELCPAKELPVKCRSFSEMTLNPGCGIGLHTHTGETEFYFILSGVGVADDDGKEVIMEKGDCLSTSKGASHSLINKGTEPLVIVACIVLD